MWSHDNTRVQVTLSMRIDFECSGGFFHLPLAYRADTNELAPGLAQELLKLAESSGFFDFQQGDAAPKSPGPPDVISYRLSLSEGGKSKSLSVNDVTAPASLHPLLTRLRELALEQRRQGR